MLNCRMDLSGLDRLKKVARRLDGQSELHFECAGGDDLEEADLCALTEEAVAHVLGDDRAQKSFLSTKSFSYRSTLLRKHVKVTQKR